MKHSILMSGGEGVRIRIVEDSTLEEDELVVYCKKKTSQIEQLFNVKEDRYVKVIDRGSEKLLNLKDILFFETNGDNVYAHLSDSSYRTPYRLYELEMMFEDWFLRISKSTLVNLRQISSLERNITSSRAIRYYKSHKVSYVSRMYYATLKHKLDERSTL